MKKYSYFFYGNFKQFYLNFNKFLQFSLQLDMDPDPPKKNGSGSSIQ